MCVEISLQQLVTVCVQLIAQTLICSDLSATLSGHCTAQTTGVCSSVRNMLLMSVQQRTQQIHHMRVQINAQCVTSVQISAQ